MGLITPYWGLDGLIIFTSLLVAAYMYMTRKFKYWSKRGVMEVPPTPFFGNFSQCFTQRKAAAEFLKDMYSLAKGLPCMGFYIFDKPALLIRDPEFVKQVLVKDFEVFYDRYATSDVSDSIGYANVFQLKNPIWKTIRARLTPIFTTGKLKRMFEQMAFVADDLNNHLESLNLKTPKAIDIKELCASFTTDVIGSTAYGVRVNSLQDPKAPFRAAGRQIHALTFYRGMEFLIIYFMPHWSKYVKTKFFGKEFSDFLRSVFWDVVNQRIQSGVKRDDLIDLLIDMKNRHEKEGDLGGLNFSGDDLVAQAAIFFSAGFETSSTTISFTLYELAVQRDVQTTLRKEIQEALAKTDGKISYEMITTLPYLDMVVSETLRKYPPLAFLDRICNQNYKVPNSDLVIEKGTPIFIPMLGLHYDPEFYPDPDKYDPLRFTDENKKNRPNFSYLPFGDGPRGCIGLRLGLMQSKLGIFQVIRRFEVTPCEKTKIPMPMDPRGLTTTALGGMYLNIQKISEV
ncbi:cytochrome P450 6k1-like [Colletes gigas]|uniref:cytochrome P450 6k1-like n=1 Tax=Colletes gigas TaxID=935657 RepID=UPI001C9B82AB|nr:cytochrome P450 6k1-like [Colletes gigas]